MPDNVKIDGWITVNDRMQRSYRYQLVARMGKSFSPGFAPHFSPKEMLQLGVFEGKYCNDCRDEFPADWFVNAKTSKAADVTCNYFGIKSRQPLQVWQEKGWIMPPDPRGWFQWYCRYYLGRRIPALDEKQIKRWKAFSRHARQVEIHCWPGDICCRRRQRQALLQWAYNPFI